MKFGVAARQTLGGPEPHALPCRLNVIGADRVGFACERATGKQLVRERAELMDEFRPFAEGTSIYCNCGLNSHDERC
jgi:hypothetical protein